MEISQSILIREQLAVFFRYKKRITRILMWTVLVSILVSFLMTKTYIAETRILVQQVRDPVRLSSIFRSSDAEAMFSAQDTINTEIEILKSPDVAKDLAQQIGPEIVLEHMTKRWDWLWELPGKIKSSIKSFILNLEWVQTLASQFGIQVKKETSTNYLEAATDKILANLDTQPVLKADVFLVTLSAPDPEFAAHALNQLVQVYLDHHRSLRSPEQEKGLLIVETEQLKKQLKDADDKLLRFKQQAQISSFDEQKRFLLQQLNGSIAELYKVKAEFQESKLRISELSSQLNKQTKDVSLTNIQERNPVIDRIRSRIIPLEIEQQEYKPDSPVARYIKQEITNLHTKLKEIEKTVSGSHTSGISQTYLDLKKLLFIEKTNFSVLKERMKNTERQLQEYKQALNHLEKEESRYKELKRIRDTKSNALQLFLKRKIEMDIQEKLDKKKIYNVSPLELARTPSFPIRPRKGLNLVLGIVVGLFFGIVVAYISNYFRRTISTNEEAEDALGKEVIGSFFLEQDKEVRSRSLLEFRRLSDSLVNTGHGPQSVLITSAVSEEGKSYIAAGLAEALNRSGKSVLIVKIQPFKREPDKLGDIENKTQSPAHVVEQLVEIVPAIDGAGGISHIFVEGNYHNCQARIESILKQYSKNHDISIIDSIDLAAFPEQLMIASEVCKVLLVVMADTVSKYTVKKYLNLLDAEGVNIAGVILNKRRMLIPEWAYATTMSKKRA